jgi:hypothetical protein
LPEALARTFRKTKQKLIPVAFEIFLDRDLQEKNLNTGSKNIRNYLLTSGQINSCHLTIISIGKINLNLQGLQGPKAKIKINQYSYS